MDSIDSLIRDLDSLGVVEEIPNFNHKISWPTGSRSSQFDEDFSREAEYSAAQKFNDEHKGNIRIIGANLSQKISINQELNRQKYFWKRYIHGEIKLSNQCFLRTYIKGDIQIVAYYDRSYFLIEQTNIKRYLIENITTPIVEYVTSMAFLHLAHYRNRLSQNPLIRDLKKRHKDRANRDVIRDK